jgi:hypothetical protein
MSEQWRRELTERGFLEAKRDIQMRKGNVSETVSNNINNEVKGLISNYDSRNHAHGMVYWVRSGCRCRGFDSSE